MVEISQGTVGSDIVVNGSPVEQPLSMLKHLPDLMTHFLQDE